MHGVGLREPAGDSPIRRAGRRAQMIKMRLGGSNDPLEPFPQKPRGMHWRTYLRLRDQANAAEAEANAVASSRRIARHFTRRITGWIRRWGDRRLRDRVRPALCSGPRP